MNDKPVDTICEDITALAISLANRVQRADVEKEMLKKRLRETEARLGARMLKILEEKFHNEISGTLFECIESVFREDVNFDALEIERVDRQKATAKAEDLEDIYEKASELKSVYQDVTYEPISEEEKEQYDEAMRVFQYKLHELFSLVDSFALQESYSASTISPEG